MTNRTSSVLAPKYCTCSDPDYCLRNATPEHRMAAVAYRRARGAPLPRKEAAMAEGAKTEVDLKDAAQVVADTIESRQLELDPVSTASDDEDLLGAVEALEDAIKAWRATR